MTQYAEHELFSITAFTKQISKLVNTVKNNTIEKIEEEKFNQEWSYWSDNEIDNFGKIAIGLSRHNYSKLKALIGFQKRYV